YNLWMMWLALPAEYLPTREYFANDQYWTLIQDGVRYGSYEQRKFCVQILKLSIKLLKYDISTSHLKFINEEKDEYIQQYEQYGTLVEIIAVGRYINQVEESLPGLQALMRSQSKLHETWIITLFASLFRPGMQDNVRKMVISWYMDLAEPPLGSHASYLDFLLTHLLPWATQGHLFIYSTRKHNGSLICKHGERLTRYFNSLVSDLQDDRTTQSYVSSIIAYIDSKRGYMFPPAMAFILHGLASALSKRLPCLSAAEAEMLVKIPATTHISDLQQDIFTSYAAILCKNIDLKTVQDSKLPRGLQLLSSRYENLRSSGTRQDQDESREKTLKHFLEKLDITKYKCLSGSGLVSGIKHIREILDTEEDLAPEQLFKALDALWNELEIQDYMKAALVAIPEVLFHPKCIVLCGQSSELASLLSSSALYISQLCQGRIYAFSPLIQALRIAYCTSPSSVEYIPFERIIGHFTNNPPSPKPEFLLEATIAQKVQEFVPNISYDSYYGLPEQFGFACLMDLINRIRSTDVDLLQSIMDSVLTFWISQKIPPPVFSKSKHTSQLQVLLLLLEPIVKNNPQDVLRYFSMFKNFIFIESLPRHRYLLEWAIARLSLHSKDVGKGILKELSTTDHAHPKFLASVMKMATTIALLPNSTEEYTDALMTCLVALSASPKIMVRHEAQWSVPPVWEHAIRMGWNKVVGNTAFEALYTQLKALEKHMNIPAPRMLERLNPVSGHTLANLFQGAYLTIDPREAPLTTTADFEAVYANDRSIGFDSLPPPRMELGRPPVGLPFLDDSTTIAKRMPSAHDDSTARVDPVDATFLQTKGAVYHDPLSKPSDPSSSDQPSLLLVASLISSPPNLGGLSRAAEIFGASSLQVPNLTILTNQVFTTVSVSSHLHLTIQELSPEVLVNWIVERKREGYTVVGVEQTDRSIILGDGNKDNIGECKIPKRCVLIMGSEKEGIPGKILAECNICVEVRQWGITRSLNVQTAAAVVMYEWRRGWGGR
ncbi:hypothetical protein M501DRAFT_914534, partial [Patellaria atrata CBS 101060]